MWLPVMTGGSASLRPGRRAKMLPIPSIAMLQPASLHQRMKRSRASPSSLVSANRRTPPLSVAPMRARSIRDFHNRCESIDIAAMSFPLYEPPQMPPTCWLRLTLARLRIVWVCHPARIPLDCLSRARVLVPDRDLLQRNAVFHGTNIHAKVAADTLLVDDFEMTPAILFIADGLMRRVLARDVAATTFDA